MDECDRLCFVILSKRGGGLLRFQFSSGQGLNKYSDEDEVTHVLGKACWRCGKVEAWSTLKIDIVRLSLELFQCTVGSLVPHNAYETTPVAAAVVAKSTATDAHLPKVPVFGDVWFRSPSGRSDSLNGNHIGIMKKRPKATVNTDLSVFLNQRPSFR